MKMERDPTYSLSYATVMPLTRDLIGTLLLPRVFTLHNYVIIAVDIFCLEMKYINF